MGPDDTSTTEVAKDQAGQVADTAKQAGAQVAGTVKEQAGQVTAEAGNQAKQLLSQAQSELTEQAAATQQRVSEGLHALADELAGMARNSEQDGAGDRPGPAGRGQGPAGRRVVGRPRPRQPCSTRSGPSPAASPAPTWRSRWAPVSWPAG